MGVLEVESNEGEPGTDLSMFDSLLGSSQCCDGRTSRLPPTANREHLTPSAIDERFVSRIAGLGKHLHEPECYVR